jgi:hypothetical protein
MTPALAINHVAALPRLIVDGFYTTKTHYRHEWRVSAWLSLQDECDNCGGGAGSVEALFTFLAPFIHAVGVEPLPPRLRYR